MNLALRSLHPSLVRACVSPCAPGVAKLVVAAEDERQSKMLAVRRSRAQVSSPSAGNAHGSGYLAVSGGHAGALDRKQMPTASSGANNSFLHILAANSSAFTSTASHSGVAPAAGSAAFPARSPRGGRMDRGSAVPPAHGKTKGQVSGPIFFGYGVASVQRMMRGLPDAARALPALDVTQVWCARVCVCAAPGRVQGLSPASLPTSRLYVCDLLAPWEVQPMKRQCHDLLYHAPCHVASLPLTRLLTAVPARDAADEELPKEQEGG